VIGFIDHSQIVTSNYNIIANLHTIQNTTAFAKTSQSAFTSRFPVTDLNSGDFSASVLTSLLSGEYPKTEIFIVRVKIRVTLRLADYRQSVHLGNKPLETANQNLYFATEHLRLQSLCRILSDERMRLSFTISAGLRQRSHSQVRVPRNSKPLFTLSDSILPQPGGPLPRIYIPAEQALGFLFSAS
jgi:hypothetical protein